MTEKRSEYRRRKRQGKRLSLLGKVKSAFSDSAEADIDTQEDRDFRRPPAGERQDLNTERQDYLKQEQERSRAEKSLRLKKKLDRAILLVIVLIVLVLLALFYL